MQPLTVPQDTIFSFISEEIAKGNWVFLHSDDVKTLLNCSQVISSVDDVFSLTWKESGDKLLLKQMSEKWLFCQKIYEDNSSSIPAETPEDFILLRLENG